MIKPTIGRVVWYWPHKSELSICIRGHQAMPALICYVWGDSCVNIAGFDANGVPFSRTSVLLYQGDTERPSDTFAEWMPYQKGQAAKTEELEKQVQHHPV